MMAPEVVLEDTPERPRQRRVARRMNESEAREVQVRFQRQLADQWLDGRHLTEVARGAGLELDQAERLVAWGLLHLGKVEIQDMVRSGYLKPKPQEGRP